MDLVTSAMVTARKSHRGQTRRDGQTPYFEHLRETVKRLRGESDTVRAVGWLHDIIEDTHMTASELADLGFSSEVINAVSLLTKSGILSYNEYLRNVRSNEIARKVKIADMLANLSDDPTQSQIRKYVEGLSYLILQ